MEQFKPVNRIGHLVRSDESPTNVYWSSEIEGLDISAGMPVGETGLITFPVSPPLEEVDGLRIGRVIEGEVPVAGGGMFEVKGKVSGFVPYARISGESDTVGFLAQITLEKPIELRGKEKFEIELPIDMIIRGS